jgi:cobalt-precorrin 5A hydrolase
VSEPAIVTLTPRGRELGRRIAAALGSGEILSAESDARAILSGQFQAGRPLICIMALGIVVRIVGPLAGDKETDPPVVVVDEGGTFAIAVLGGHAAGANDLARDVARAIGAVPVITTASECLGLPALDLIGRLWGWQRESDADLTAVSAASIRGEPIAVYQDAGYPHWWHAHPKWPAHFHWVRDWPVAAAWAGVLAITDRVWPKPNCPVVTYRPRTLVFGIGCRRGVTCDEIDEMFQRVCEEHRLSPLSLGRIVTVDLKREEPGLIDFARSHGVSLAALTPEKLAQVKNLPTPSKKVQALIGIPGVAEPAAMAGAGTRELLVRKQHNSRITMAVARSRIEFQHGKPGGPEP